MVIEIFFDPLFLESVDILAVLAVNFLVFTAMKANPNSFSTFSLLRTEKRVKHKLAFRNPKTGSTSILVYHKFSLFLFHQAAVVYTSFVVPIVHVIDFPIVLLSLSYIANVRDKLYNPYIHTHDNYAEIRLCHIVQIGTETLVFDHSVK